MSLTKWCLANIFHAWCTYNNPPIMHSFYYCPISRVCCPPGVHLSTNFFVWPAHLGLDTLSHYLSIVWFHDVSGPHSLLPDTNAAHFRGHYWHKRGPVMIQIPLNHGPTESLLFTTWIKREQHWQLQNVTIQSKAVNGVIASYLKKTLKTKITYLDKSLV